MTRIIVSILLIMPCALPLWAQEPFQKLRPELEKLEDWIGDWDFEIDIQATPLGPAGKSMGEMIVRPILGGFFLEFRGRRTGSVDSLGWLLIDGYDGLNKNYVSTGFDTNGSITSCTYTLDGTAINYSGTFLVEKEQHKIRGTIVPAPDFMSGVEKREISVDGQTWIPYFQLKFIRIK